MGLFTQSSPFDADVEKATSETNTNEDWTLILDVCDKVSSNPRSAKDCLKAIMKRMNHADPHVVMQAITLLDACVNNCGKPFHLEIASRDFENEFRRLLAKAQPKVSLKMRQVLKSWAENDFKSEHELNLIPSLYNSLKQEGVDFSNLGEKNTKASQAKAMAALKDPNVVSSQQEEDDIAKAIELSLKETKGSPKQQTSSSTRSSTTYPSLYPSFGGTTTSNGGGSDSAKQPEPRKVRALYDFEAAEDNELTFYAGEILHVVDDSDPNWWKGSNQRGEGLFPSNFVSADLSVDPERLDINQQNKTKKSVQFENDTRELEQKTEAAAAAAANQRVEIDEEKIDRLLHLLHEANPEDPSQDSEEMLRLEQEVHQMGPLIDAELERVDRKHAQLTQLSSDLVDAINLYHSLMRDDRAAAANAFLPPGHMQQMLGPGSMNYSQQPSTNPQMALYGAAGYPGNFQQQPGYHPPMNSNLQYMPPSGAGPSIATTTAAPQFAASQSQNPAMLHGQQPIPIQFQNGHVNAAQVNGGVAASSMPQPPYQMLPMQQQQQAYPPPASAVTTANSQQNQTPMQMQPQSSAPPPTPPHQQYMSPQHQQLYTAPLPNGPPHPQSMAYMPQQPGTAPGGSDGGVGPMNMMQAAPQQQQSATQQHLVNNNHMDHQQQHQQQQQQQQQYLNQQLHQQMAAMSLGSNGGGVVGVGGMVGGVGGMAILGGNAPAGPAMNQPITQSFLVQNEPKNNIPIYQQQR